MSSHKATKPLQPNVLCHYVKRPGFLENKLKKTKKLNDSLSVCIFPPGCRPSDRIGMQFSQATFTASSNKKSQMLCE